MQVVGKVRFATEEYEAVMEQRKDIALTIDWEDGRSDVLSGAEIYKLIFDSNHMPWMLECQWHNLYTQSLKVLFQVF